jgi:hypothetical protein
MPGYHRAELSVEVTVPAGEPAEPVRRAAGETGLASESGPATLLLAGGRDEVLTALRRVLDAGLDAGAHVLDVRVEAQRFAGEP